MVPAEKVALALSDPIRLQILDLLAAGRAQPCCSPENPDAPGALCSCDLISLLDLAPSRVSYHLKELREAGLISEQRRGRWIYMSVDRRTLGAFAQYLQERFVADTHQSVQKMLFNLD